MQIAILTAAMLLVFLLVLLVRTWRFKPQTVEKIPPFRATLDEEKIVADMVEMIRCKTVSHTDMTKADMAEFEKFHALLVARFPRVTAACTLMHIGPTGLLYRLAGRSDESPSVMMAHYDVVPADEGAWQHPPFAGVVENGKIWGRGTLDTKGTLLAVMEALEQLLGEGFVPQNDLYLSFAGDEEVMGESTPAIVSYFEKNGIRPALVLDEGGAVVDNLFPGVTGACAVVGIAEKGIANLSFSMTSGGGHASTPPVHTVAGHLARAIVRIEKHPFSRRLTPPVRQMLDTLGRRSTFLYRFIFANLWCFAPLLDAVCRRTGGELNALLRTTVAVTKMQGSNAFNVLPPAAEFGVNIRLMAGDTLESATAYLNRVIDNPAIVASVVNGNNASPTSSTSCEAWQQLTRAIAATWQDAIVSPYLMMACSDSRHYCRICDKVYRFSPMHMSAAERATIHGNDECVPAETLFTATRFYLTLLRGL